MRTACSWQIQRKSSLAGLLLGVLALGGCGEARLAGQRQGLREPRIEVLVGIQQGRSEVVLDLEEVRLIQEDGTGLGLPLLRRRLDSREGGARVLVAGGTVPTDPFIAIRLVFRSAFLRDGEDLRSLTLRSDSSLAPADSTFAGVAVDIPVSLTASSQDTVSAFLAWDVEASLRTGLELRPQFAVTVQKPQGSLGRLFVADRGADVVLGVDRASGQVTSSLSVGAGPNAVSLARDRRHLCSANAEDGSISVMNLIRNEERFRVPVRFGAQTSDVEVVDDLGLVAATNAALNTVTIFRLDGGARVTDLRVGRNPVGLAASARHRRLFVLNQDEDSMSVVDLSTMTVVTTVATQASPSYVLVGPREEVVVVGHLRSPQVLLIDADSLVVENAVSVGDRVTAICADRRQGRFYVARRGPRELAVVDRGMAAVTRRIPLSAVVTGLARPEEGALIYGASAEAGGLVVVDLVMGRELPLIPCGREPVDVLVVE